MKMLWSAGMAIVLAANTVLAGKLQLPDDIKYPNIVAPKYEIGGYGTKLAAALGDIQDIEFSIDNHLLVSEGASRKVLKLSVNGDILAQSETLDSADNRYAKLRGLTVVGAEELYVIDAAQRNLNVLNEKLELTRTLPLSETIEPYDVAVIGRRAFITDNSQSAIHVYDLESGDHLERIQPVIDDKAIKLPLGIVAHNEELFVADSGNHRILVLRPEGEIVRSWGGWGSYGGQLASPYNVAIHGNRVFVADQINHRLQAFSLHGEFEFQWARHPPTAHEGGGRVHYPSTIAVDQKGNHIAVCEVIESRCQIFSDIANSDRIAKVGDSAWWEKETRFHYGAQPMPAESFLSVTEPDTHSVLLFRLKEVDGRLRPQFITRAGGQGSKPGQMVQPSGSMIDPKNQRLWVSDRGNLRIQEFEFSEREERKRKGKDDAVTKLSQGYGSHKFVKATYVGPNVPFDKKAERLSEAVEQRRIGEPGPMTRHPNGDVYMVDPALGRVHVFDKDMKYQRTWGHYGAADDQLLKPLAIAVSPNGKRIYVVDEYAFKVKVFSPNGAHLFSWGGAGIAQDQFVTPFGITVNKEGDVFVSDTAKNEIKKFNADGKFLLAFGSWGAGPGGFYKPKGLGTDYKNRLIVMDFGNHRGQVFNAEGEFLAMFGISENPDEINANR